MCVMAWLCEYPFKGRKEGMSSTKSILWEQVKGLMSLTNLDVSNSLTLCAVLKTNMMRHFQLFTTFYRDNPAMLPPKCHKRQNRFYGGQNGTIETDLQLNVGKSYAFRIQLNSIQLANSQL